MCLNVRVYPIIVSELHVGWSRLFLRDGGDVTRSDFAKCRTCLPRMILKTNSRCSLRKVIRLDVCFLAIFTPYYDPAPPTWKVVANSILSCL